MRDGCADAGDSCLVDNTRIASIHRLTSVPVLRDMIEHMMANPEIQELFLLGRIIWILIITLLSLSYLTVCLRLWVRRMITRNLGWDDVAMVVTLVSTGSLFGGWMMLM